MSEKIKHVQQKFLSILRRESGDWVGKPIPAVTGNEDGLVDAGYGKIYVRLANGQEQTVLCSFNVDWDWHVTLGRLKSSPGIWRVREVRGTYLTMPPNRIGYHHAQHEGVDAPDRVMLDRRQILQSTILVYNAANFEIIIGPNHAPTKTGLVSYVETILDLSSYVPTEGAVFINVEVDETGALSLHAGDPITAPSAADNSYVPVPDFEHYFIGTILLYETQAQLSNNDIRVPFPLSTNYLLDAAAFSDILVSIADIQSAFETLDTHTHTGGSATWGSITGTLSDQTDLQTALDARIRFFVFAGAPTAGDDETLDYRVSDWWMNSDDNSMYQAFSVGTGTAVWMRVSNELGIEYFNATLASIADADLIGFYDDSAGDFRVISGTDFKAFLKTYFDTLYATPAYVDAAEADAKAYADGLVVGLWDDRGSFDASGGAYPSTGGSGTAGAILKGDAWTISVAGTLPTGQAVEIGDVVRALVDTPGNTQANWAITQNNIGYVAENSANKSTDVNTDQASNTKYPSVKAVYDWAVGLFTQKNTAITGATKTKITYDAKGLVTSGTDATTADIADSTNKRYVTDADLTDIGNLSGTNTGDNPGGRANYGDGSDGAATLDGVNTYAWASLSGSTYTLLRDVYLTNLTVNSAKILKGTSFRIFGTGTLTNDGTIHANGSDASADVAGGVTSSGFFIQGTDGGAGVASGGAAAGGTIGSAGNAGAYGAGLGGRGAAGWATAITRLGSSGGLLSTAFPVASSGGFRITRNMEAILNKLPLGNTLGVQPGIGAGGGGKSAVGTACNSGGGGGGGGAMAILFRIIINTGTISASGGNGGNAGGTGANAGGGGGGGGGLLWLVYDSLTNSGTISANGGTGGTSVAGGSTPTRAVGVTAAIATSATVSSNAITLLAATSGRLPSKNTLYICYAHQNGGTLNTPTVTGWGLTWTLINTVDFNTIASPTRRLCVWYAYGTPNLNDDTDAVVVQYSSAPTGAQATISEFQNAPGTIVQSVTNATNSATTLTATLAAVGSTNAACIGVFAFSAGTARVAGAGFSVVEDDTGAPQMTTELSYNDTTVDISWTTAAAAAGIAFEVQAIGAMENGQDGHAGQVIQLQNA